MREIDSAARKHRAREERKRARAAAKPDPARVARSMIVASVAEADTGFRQYVRAGIVGVVLVAAMWAEAEIPALASAWDAGWWPKVVIVVVDIALCFAAMLAHERVVYAWQMRHLRGIGHGFDVGRYLQLLAQKRSRGSLRASLHCGEPWNGNDRQKMLDAVKEWLPAVDATWRGDCVLELRSESLYTIASETPYDEGVSKDIKFFTNRPLHDVFMHIASRVLPKLDRAHPVERIEVAIEGDVLPYDADPN